VGTELLLGQIVNTNAQYLSRQMASLGVNVYFQTVVGDNAARMAFVIKQAQERSDILLITGGLGPTMDDITKEVLAGVLGREMVFDESVWQEISGYFSRTGRPMTANNRRQAFVIEGSCVLHNPYGTAPGILVEHDRRVYVLFPGPPRELHPMFEDQVRPYLVEHGYAGREVIHSRLLRICGLGESTAEDMVKDLMATSQNPTIAPYASLAEVHLRVTAKTQDIREARSLVDRMTLRLRERLGDNVFGFDETTLERAVGARLMKVGVTLALAESCTGGLLGQRITSVPGSSDYFLGGIVSYSNEAKKSLLGVSATTLSEHGAVSLETAREMVHGAMKAFGSDIGIAITGVAGPSGGSPQKPVGTVCIALKTPWEEEATVHRFRPPRADINWRSSQQALTSLWLLLGKVLAGRGEPLEPVGP